MENHTFRVAEQDNNKRLDAYLSAMLEGQSRSYIQKLIDDDQVHINGVVETTKKVKVKTGDEVRIGIPEPVELSVEAEDIPIAVVYEDSDVIIVNKNQGMVVHPAPGNYTGTLVNALMFRCKDLSSINGVIRPGIVHRIDKDTSGLLMIAKNDHAHQVLAEQLKEHSVTRVYHAIVHGNIREEAGTVNAPIGRNPNNRLKMAVTPKNSKEAVTHYKVLKRYKQYTYIELRLETGRTHQIRVHMAHIGHPLVGDPLYGVKKEKIKHDGQLLHAKTLGFIHPTKGTYMEFDSELPEYFQGIMRKIEAVTA